MSDKKQKRKVRVTGGGGSNLAPQVSSIGAAEWLQRVGSVPAVKLETASRILVNHRSIIEHVVADMTPNLPPKSDFPGREVVIVVRMCDLSRSEAPFVDLLAMADNMTTTELLAGPMAQSTLLAKVGFNTDVEVIQPFTLMNGAESQIWFTHDMSKIKDEHRQYYHQLYANGGTDANLALVASLAAAMKVDTFYRSQNMLPKVIVVGDTDGDHNGDIDFASAIAFIEAARAWGNVQIAFVGIGNPLTQQYVRRLQLPDTSYMDVERTEEGFRTMARQVSTSISRASTARGQLGSMAFFDAVVNGDTVQMLDLTAMADDGGDNGLFDFLEDEPLEDDLEFGNQEE